MAKVFCVTRGCGIQIELDDDVTWAEPRCGVCFSAWIDGYLTDIEEVVPHDGFFVPRRAARVVNPDGKVQEQETVWVNKL